MNKQYFDSFQELRGLTALCIVLSHIPMALMLFGNALGNFGVPIFYMLSAFLTVYVAKPGVGRFFKKRIIKIVPLYYLMTVFTYVLVLKMPYSFSTAVAEPQYLIKSLLFIPYISPKSGLARPILDVGWTLTAEVAFYLMFGLAMSISYKHRNVITLAMLGIVWIVGKIPFSWEFQFLFGGYSKYVIYFVGGMLIAMAYDKVHAHVINRLYTNDGVFDTSVSLIPSWLLTLLKIAIIWGGALLYEHVQWYIGPDKWQDIAITFVVFIAFLFLNDLGKSSKVLVWLGGISYELYLTHEFIVKGFQRMYQRLLYVTPKTVAVAVLCVLSSILVAAVAHFVMTRVEKILK